MNVVQVHQPILNWPFSAELTLRAVRGNTVGTLTVGSSDTSCTTMLNDLLAVAHHAIPAAYSADFTAFQYSFGNDLHNYITKRIIGEKKKLLLSIT
jgi:uncharacterized protein (DUF2237 family)